MKVLAQYLQIKNPAAIKVRLQDRPGPEREQFLNLFTSPNMRRLNASLRMGETSNEHRKRRLRPRTEALSLH
jgi:hypothetical protein